jgi:hypothetical protein
MESFKILTEELQQVREAANVKSIAKDAEKSFSKWMKGDSSEFFSGDDEEKYDAIDNDIDDFFSGTKLNKNFVSKNRKAIIKAIIKEL